MSQGIPLDYVSNYFAYCISPFLVGLMPILMFETIFLYGSDPIYWWLKYMFISHYNTYIYIDTFMVISNVLSVISYPHCMHTRKTLVTIVHWYFWWKPINYIINRGGGDITSYSSHSWQTIENTWKYSHHIPIIFPFLVGYTLGQPKNGWKIIDHLVRWLNYKIH